MNPDFMPYVKEKLSFPENTGSEKIMELSEAVRRYVRPGMSIHQGCGLVAPTPICFEIARQFWGKDPRFTIIAVSGGSYTFGVWAFGKLCRKIICAFYGDGYPFPSPNPILAGAFRDKSVELENWSQLGIMLRLMAGALGIPFFPTRSIAGSTMESEYSQSFQKIENPFAEGGSIGLLRALRPDISVVHGLAADPDGNTILAAPYSGNHYGPLAARQGAIVTVERLVDADFIRRHSYLPQISGYAVRAVCPLPMGGHPMGIHAYGVPEMEGYGEDEEFIMESRRVSRDPETFRAWVEKWVLGCRDHQEFLNLLGRNRIWYLKGRIHKDAWQSELAESAGQITSPPEATKAELIVSAASGKLQEIIREKGYRIILCGIGVSNLASWLAYYDLRRREYPLELVAEIGYYGYSPQPGDPAVFNLRNVPSCRGISDTLSVLGCMISGPAAPRIGVLGAAQVDRFGNVNSTRLSETGPWLVGSGGANDVASGADETVVVMEQSQDRFVEKVAFITSPGTAVTTVISQFGIFEKEHGAGELQLCAYFPQKDARSGEDSVRAIREQCGWNLAIRPELKVLSFPTPEDLTWMRCFDPRRLFLGGPESKRKK